MRQQTNDSEHIAVQLTRPSASTLRDTLDVSLGPSWRVFGAHTTSLYGAEASLEWRRLEVAAASLWGGRSDALGAARYTLVDASLAAAVWRSVWERWMFSMGARAALGMVWGDAKAQPLAIASRANAPTWNIAAQMALARVASRRWKLQLIVQAGYAGGPTFKADTRTLAALSGPFVGACFSAALGLLGR